MWNSNTFVLVTTLTGHTDLVLSLAIMPLNENIVSGSEEKRINVWNSKTFNLNMDDEILKLTFLSNFHLSTLSRNGIIRVWNFYTCENITEYYNKDKIRKQHLSLDYFSDTGDLAFSEDRSIKILNTGLLYSNFSNIN